MLFIVFFTFTQGKNLSLGIHYYSTVQRTFKKNGYLDKYIKVSLSLPFSLVLSLTATLNFTSRLCNRSSNSGGVILRSVAEPGTGRRHSRAAPGSDSCHFLPPGSPTD